MKALTVSQPYASLIASGEKWIENRTWETRFRGLLAIHAGKGTQYMFRREMDSKGLPRGKIIAVATLVACVRLSVVREMDASSQRKQIVEGTTKNWFEVARHQHAEGPWCWILEDVVPRGNTLGRSTESRGFGTSRLGVNDEGATFRAAKWLCPVCDL